MVNAGVVKDFNTYPDPVAKVAELIAKGRSICVILGDHESVATTWDGDDIRAIARKVELDPREDGSLAYICWTAGTTIDHPAEAATIAITTKAGGAPEA
jgi:hypothetical protein